MGRVKRSCGSLPSPNENIWHLESNLGGSKWAGIHAPVLRGWGEAFGPSGLDLGIPPETQGTFRAAASKARAVREAYFHCWGMALEA